MGREVWADWRAQKTRVPNSIGCLHREASLQTLVLLLESLYSSVVYREGAQPVFPEPSAG